MQITLSIPAAQSAIQFSQETSQCLMANVGIMDNEVNSQFSGLQDPSIQKYLQLSESMQSTIRQISQKLDDICEYCQGVIQWIIDYTSR